MQTICTSLQTPTPHHSVFTGQMQKVTAAYRRVYGSRHLQADCQEPGSALEPRTRQLSMGYLYVVYCMRFVKVLINESQSVSELLLCTCVVEYADCSWKHQRACRKHYIWSTRLPHVHWCCCRCCCQYIGRCSRQQITLHQSVHTTINIGHRFSTLPRDHNCATGSTRKNSPEFSRLFQSHILTFPQVIATKSKCNNDLHQGSFHINSSA